MKRILIADDYQVVRQGIIQLLRAEFPQSELGEASNAAEVLSSVHDSLWDLLVLDINMPGRSGLDVLEQLRAEGHKLPVLVVSMHDEDQMAVRSIRSGAWGYVSKSAPASEIVLASRMLLNGERYITPRVAGLIATDISEPEATYGKPHDKLTARQLEVFRLIAKGMLLTDIAAHLSLSRNTVSTTRQIIMEKLKVSTNAELVTYAVRNQLL